MIVYAIKTPKQGIYDPMIWWFGNTQFESWTLFFTENPYQAPINNAIKAYEAIGYKCVKLKLEEVKE